MKLCIICNEVKITKHHNSYCSKCLYQKQKKYFQSDVGKEKIRLNTRLYNRKKNGFTEELFALRFKQQDKKCGICKSDMPSRSNNAKKDWHGDHDHNTGIARGILCSGCNTLLGRIESVGFDWVDNAKEYLKKYKD
jgi:hypothetical protein